MANPFSRSLRSLSSEGFFSGVRGFVVLALLMIIWGAWFFRARISIYVSTENARVEAGQAAYPVQATVAGRVIAVQMNLGQEVHTGDTLVELQSDVEALNLREEQARDLALLPQLEALRAEIRAEGQALETSRQATRKAVEEALARQKEAQAGAQFAQEQAERFTRLRSAGLVSEADLNRAVTEAQKQTASADAIRLAVNRLEEEQRSKANEQQARIESLRSQQALLEGQIGTQASTLKRLQAEVQKRTIRSPASGRLGEVANLKVGQVVQEGERLGTVVPPGTLRIIAEFTPSESLGRVQAGQPARMRLDGFPWIEYGTISATVSSVASEVRDGRIRVELIVQINANSRIPLQHGLPGTVEVEVERVSPAVLVLRAAGKRVEGQR